MNQGLSDLGYLILLNRT